MGLGCKIVLVVFAALAAYVGFQIKGMLDAPEVPKLDEPWWGPGKPGQDDTAIKPFKINVPDEVI